MLQEETKSGDYGKYSLDDDDNVDNETEATPYMHYMLGIIVIALIFYMYKNFQSLRRKLFGVNNKAGDNNQDDGFYGGPARPH